VIPPEGEDFVSESDGDILDIEQLPEDGNPFEDVTIKNVTDVTPERVKLVKAPPRANTSDAATGKPPSADEWQKFFARFVVRGITSGYLALVLRDIEDELTPAEREKIALSQDDLMELAAPLASFSSKNKFMTKHGRQIVSAAGSSESVIALMFWMRRVNKIAKRHRNNQPIQGTVESRNDVSGANAEQGYTYVPGPSFNPGSGS
jgi:hypothetical protein